MVMQQGRGVLAGIQQGTPVVGHKRSLDVLESTRQISQEGQGKAIAVLKKLSGSLKLWDPSAPKKAPFKPEIVTRLYTQLSRPKGQRVVQLLELSQYLECYLWAHFDDKASSDEHVMSVIVLVNEKFREGVPAWDTFVGASAPENTPADTQKWRGFVHRVLSLVPGEPSISGRPMAPHEATQYLRFLIHLFQSLEAAHVRAVALPLTSIPLWHALSARRREMELLKDPGLAKKWRAMIRKDGKDAAAAKAEGLEHTPQKQRPEATFLPSMLSYFLTLLRTVVELPSDASPIKEELMEDEAQKVGEESPAEDEDSESSSDEDVEIEGEDVDGEGEGTLGVYGTMANGNHAGGGIAGEDDNGAGETGEAVAVTGAAARQPRRDAAGVDHAALHFCERFLELLIDLLSQLPTRRFLHALLSERNVLVKAQQCRLYGAAAGSLFRQLLEQFQFYMAFPVDNHTGEALQELDLDKQDDDAVLQFQRLLFRYWPPLKDIALTNCANARKPETLHAALVTLPPADLRRLVSTQLRLVAAEDSDVDDAAYLRAAVVTRYSPTPRPKTAIAAMPLYPTETLLWDEHQIPDIHYTGEACLALPKLNLQFLTFWDYLLRNFHLFRLEAAYEIREDVGDVLKRIQPCLDPRDGSTQFKGWSRMAIQISSFNVIEVARAAVGESKPAAVTAELTYDLSAFRRGDVKDEWDELKEHDVVFLLSIRPPNDCERAGMSETGIAATAGLRYLRGAEVLEIRDEEGQLFNDIRGRVKPEDAHKLRIGTKRTLLLALDTAQYQIDVDALEPEGVQESSKAGSGWGVDAIYGTLNILQRRKAKENNFKAVLESIRDLMDDEAGIPEWMHDLFLGYGEPSDAQYPSIRDLMDDKAGIAEWMHDCSLDTETPQPLRTWCLSHALPNTIRHLDLRDTILDAKHLADAFADYVLEFHPPVHSGPPEPPFRVTFPPFSPDPDLPSEPLPAGTPEPAEKTLVIQSYTPEQTTPFPQLEPPKNRVRFNKEQLQVIISALQPGLTMCVGPPGTGKTDTAVQALTLLYHNFPGQRILVVAHSNQALNDIFSKTIQRSVPARYLLRLGMGQEELETEVDFSRTGRVNAMLQRRIDLLEEVTTLAQQLGEAPDAGYTCETAGYFYLLHVLGRWERFVATVSTAEPDDVVAVARLFPFKEFFAEAPQPLFKEQSVEEDMRTARVCWRHLQGIFKELEECRAFELLRGQADRVNYLVTKHAKIVAMTCTHAALKRREFLKLGFRYDTLLMEEAAQILEIETLIPMLLQAPQDGHNRLKRVILIGDHHQLPPVVKNHAFQKYSHLDQPLFTRFVRLGVPYVELSAQGRARPSIAKLYNWRYRNLGDLPHVCNEPHFKEPNAGFALDFQFVDVAPLRGPGEIAPSPYFYQNVDEAEFVVRTYMYMRLIGYPAERITLLTTYNGQKALLDDVVTRYCAHNPLFGPPAKVSTVDKYQGQQNDYVLLSLVRTRNAGHLRDVRRLVVATSRAKLGLYIFGCRALFEQCHELEPTFRILLERPTTLQLLTEERWGDRRRIGKRGAAGRSPVGVGEALGGIEVQSLPHLEGIVQGVADGVAAEVRQQAASSGEGVLQGGALTAAPGGAEAADAARAAVAHRTQLTPPMPPTAGKAAATGPPTRPPHRPQPPPHPQATAPMHSVPMRFPSAPGSNPGFFGPPWPHSLFPRPEAALPQGPPIQPGMLMHPHPAGMAWVPPQVLAGPPVLWHLPPEAFVVPHFLVQAPVDAPPGEIIVGEPLKMKEKPKGRKAKKGGGGAGGPVGRTSKKHRKGVRKMQPKESNVEDAVVGEQAGIVEAGGTNEGLGKETT